MQHECPHLNYSIERMSFKLNRVRRSLARYEIGLVTILVLQLTRVFVPLFFLPLSLIVNTAVEDLCRKCTNEDFIRQLNDFFHRYISSHHLLSFSIMFTRSQTHSCDKGKKIQQILFLRKRKKIQLNDRRMILRDFLFLKIHSYIYGYAFGVKEWVEMI